MKNAPTHNCGESVPDKRDYTPGTLPKRPDTFRATVLVELLCGRDLTRLDSLVAQNTTRLSTVIFDLEKYYGWRVQRHNIMVRTTDGRYAWVIAYYLHRATIAEARKRGARSWISAVLMARLRSVQ